jgi:hypothetical protein
MSSLTARRDVLVLFNLIASLPRLMLVSDIECQDKSVYNEERARA